jgi:hypothetical protein
MSSRPDNLAACSAVEHGKSPLVPAASTRTSDEALSDQAWLQTKHKNFICFVGSLVIQEPKLKEWWEWLSKIPLSVFMAGGDHELKGVRGASTDEQRAAEAAKVLDRWSLDHGFDLERICRSSQEKLRLYIRLFASC